MPKSWTCTCGDTEIEQVNGIARVSGRGWHKGHNTGQVQYIVCHSCKDKKRIGLGVEWVDKKDAKPTRSESSKADKVSLGEETWSFRD